MSSFRRCRNFEPPAISTAILTGQAAGAAVLSLREGCAVADLPIRCLQDMPEADDVMIHFPDSYLPEELSAERIEKHAAPIEGRHL